MKIYWMGVLIASGTNGLLLLMSYSAGLGASFGMFSLAMLMLLFKRGDE